MHMRINRKVLTSVLAGMGMAGTLALSGGAGAETRQAEVYTRISALDMGGILEAAGYPVEYSTDSDGEPKIESTTIDGINFSIYFYDCTAGKFAECDTLQFRAIFTLANPLTPDSLNDFNRSWVFGKAYAFEDGDLSLELPLLLAEGVSAQNLSEQIGLWETIVGDWLLHVNW